MAWRFKASKYKNAAPIVPKPEQCIRDIVVGSYQTFGNNIAASAAFMAFNWDHVGSSLAVLPIDDCGRKSKTMPLLHAHTDTVTDLEFSPFHDGLLATSSQDCLVKIWHIPEKGLETSLTNPECTFSHKQRRVERVGFHPTADCLLYSTSAGNINLWDLTEQKEIFSNNEHPEVIQAISWKQDGTMLATTCKDKAVRVIDPRATDAIVQTADSHQSIKDSRIVWLGSQNRILTTGFDAARLRQVIIRDLRNFSTPEKTLELDCSTGILMPLYDPDTNMLFLAGKGDTTIGYMEVTDKDPYLIEGIRHSGEQTKGACVVPKRALRVMEGEVNRVLQLTSNSVIPIMYQVPRKTYRDFHADLYPETVGYRSELLPNQWMNGVNKAVPKMSLDPAKRELGDQPIVVLRGNLSEIVKNINNKFKKTTPVMTTPTGETLKPIPIKDKIKQMEMNNRLVENEFEQIFKEVTTQRKSPRIESLEQKQSPEYREDDEKTDDEKSVGGSCGNGNGNGNGGQNGDHDAAHETNGGAVPPKPLPRTSRTNSMTESNSLEEMMMTSPTPRPPQPKPRTTNTYKPRLGPKPFSSGGPTEFSFDKVFSVPQVPGGEGADPALDKPDLIPIDEKPSYFEDPDPEEVTEPVTEPVTEEPITEDEPEQQELSPETEEIVEVRKKSDEEIFKRPTTAERIKIFERSESGEDATDDHNKNNFDRHTNQRSSIAERRRLYESKSQSVAVDEKPASPMPLKRRDSLKLRGEIKEEEPKRVAVPPEFLRKPSDLSKDDIVRRNSVKKDTSNTVTAPSKRTSTVFGRVSKFRHLKGTPGHKSTQIENIRNISRQVPGECDGFQANFERVAVPLSGAGGKIAIFELSKPGKLPDGVIPSLVNGSNIMDFQWDPFNSRRLGVACDDGLIKLWCIPDGGLKEPTNEPLQEFVAHSDKIYCFRYHPIAKNVCLTASYDMTVKIWDLDTLTEQISLYGHTDQIFSIAWSPCGTFIASVCKDGKIRVFEPRKSTEPIAEGAGPVGTRGARICWAIEGEYLVVTGFDKVSERQISLYKATDLSAPLNTVGLDVAPAILMPYYDDDSSTLFVTGKGDSTIYAFEITDEAPYICPLSHHRCTGLHQGLSFLPKNQCDVTIVEFAKAFRLTNSAVEPLSFTVPRIKSELFQDDLFPATRVTWLPTLSAAEWFAQKDKKVPRISLQPEGMECLSATQLPATNGNSRNAQKIQKDPSANGVHPAVNRLWNSDLMKSKEQDIKSSVSARMEVNYKLEQDEMEGVDEEEWVE